MYKNVIIKAWNQEEKIMNVLVCGGAGYIGSHICVELLDAG